MKWGFFPWEQNMLTNREHMVCRETQLRSLWISGHLSSPTPAQSQTRNPLASQIIAPLVKPGSAWGASLLRELPLPLLRIPVQAEQGLRMGLGVR